MQQGRLATGTLIDLFCGLALIVLSHTQAWQAADVKLLWQCESIAEAKEEKLAALTSTTI